MLAVAAVAAAAALPDADRYRAQSLEKMVALVAMLTEKSRSTDTGQLDLPAKDFTAIISGKVNTSVYTFMCVLFISACVHSLHFLSFQYHSQRSMNLSV